MGKFWNPVRAGLVGDRTTKQQLTGLDQVWERVAGKFVLDLGCAEGAIALECCRAGAGFVEGHECRRDAVLEFNRLRDTVKMPMQAHWTDLNHWNAAAEPRRFDVLLMLAILHKLEQPARFLERVLEHKAEPACTVVLRTRRRDWPMLRDFRSKGVPQDIAGVLRAAGFEVVLECDGPRVDGEPPERVVILERKAA